MKMNELGKRFSIQYFQWRKKAKDMLEKHIHKSLEKEKKLFFKNYGLEPREKDIQDMKKDIVMRQGMFAFIIVVVFVLILQVI